MTNLHNALDGVDLVLKKLVHVGVALLRKTCATNESATTKRIVVESIHDLS